MNKFTKIAIAAAISVATMSVSAQNASTGPNKVYIEQIGNSNTVTIEQVGGSNSVGGTANATASNTNYATIIGSTNTVTVTQTGDSNLNQYLIKGNTNQYTSTVSGNSNTVRLNVGDTNNSNNLRNLLTEVINGNNNLLTQLVVGNDITSTYSITGNFQEIDAVLKSNKGINDITVAGNYNKLDIEQLDVAGANGHYLKQVITGDYNSIVTQQQGTNDTTIDIKTTGDHNTITVRSSSSVIVAPKTAVAR